ncbi:MAG: ABC transporter permease [Actinomycetota bacterium]|nr:ABC transporter permease [Actinomycetota bacterium]
MPPLTADPQPDQAEPADVSFRPETIRIEPTKGFSRVLSPRELWRYRDLAWQIAARDVTVRYRQTALGAAWAVLQPLGLMAVFTAVFSRFGGLSPDDGTPYALFALAALVPWAYFSNTLLFAAESLIVNTELVSKTYFPRIFIPAGVIAAGLIDLGVSLVLLLAVTFVYGIDPTPALLALPFLIFIVAATALGVGSGLAAINVRYRDVRYAVPFTVQLWFFLTPVVYWSGILSEPWQTISAINPLVGVTEGFRWAVLGMDAPWELMGISLASAAILFVAGMAYFDRVERGFADFI